MSDYECPGCGGLLRVIERDDDGHPVGYGCQECREEVWPREDEPDYADNVLVDEMLDWTPLSRHQMRMRLRTSRPRQTKARESDASMPELRT